MRDAAAEPAFTIEPLGETMLVVRFGDCVDADLNARVHAAAATLRASGLPGISDFVPAYASLGLIYRPERWSHRERPAWRHFADAVHGALATAPPPVTRIAAVIDVPVCYGGEYGPDLDAVAHHCGLSADAVAARHANGAYQVAMLGFAPGFAYLLGLDATLHMPRRADPRLRVPRGSVAIGGAQTGIYPAELPGGWHLVGRTPLDLFDPARDPACVLAAGDRVRLRAISPREFAVIQRRSSQ